LIFIDTETTGLLKPDAASLHLQPYITEIYVVKLTDKLSFIDEFETLIKPPIPIPDETSKVSGITNELVANAPKFIEVYDRLVDLFMGERITVGHNVSFDLGVLWSELARHRLEFHFPWSPTWLCTVEKSTSIKHKRLSLKDLHMLATGHAHEDAHRAKSDVLAMIRCYQWMEQKGLI